MYLDFDLSAASVGTTLKTTEQTREIEWLKRRLGKFTASQFSRLVAYPNKDELPAGAITYVMEKVVEVATDFEPEQGFTTAAMQWGKDHELEAIGRFESEFNFKVDFTGEEQTFIDYPDLRAGATPDGLIGNDAGVEIKCPNSATHLKYMAIKCENTLKHIAPDYYWQIQGQLMITGCDRFYFVSYDPRFKDVDLQLHIAIIQPIVSDIEFLKQRLSMAHDYFKKICERRGIDYAA